MSCVHSEYSVLIPPLAPVHSTSILSKKVHLFLLAAKTLQHPAVLSGLVCGLPLQICVPSSPPCSLPQEVSGMGWLPYSPNTALCVVFPFTNTPLCKESFHFYNILYIRCNHEAQPTIKRRLHSMNTKRWELLGLGETCQVVFQMFISIITDLPQLSSSQGII